MSDQRDEAVEPEQEGLSAPAARRTCPIVVNGRRCEVATREVGHGELVRLAYPGAHMDETNSVSVSYRRGPTHASQGILAPSERTAIAAGEVFSVIRTDKS